VLTKAAALEGTHVLAADLASRLSGVSKALLENAQRYGDELSVVPEARRALELGATAMHDPTEGGIVGACWEMAEASGCGFRVFASAIPVREATQAICDALGVDPLRLIASGALLIACGDGERMVAGLRAAGIQATPIGEMTEPDQRRLLVHAGGDEEEVTQLDRDELYRILEDNATSP
jgi:hydrogenase expression/formation protein HypE